MKREMIVGIGASAVTAVVLLLAYFFLSQPLSDSTMSYGITAPQAGYGERAVAGEDSTSKSADTMLAYSFSMTVEVSDLVTAEPDVKAIVAGYGGYLAGLDGRYEKQSSTTLTFKLPAGNLEEAGQALKALGEVKSESLDAYDVKSEYDELSARIESLTAERARLIDFYGRANETSDLIEISSRLSYVDSQLNYLNLRKAELEDVVEYSTLYVTLNEKMGALSKFVFVELADLVGNFSSGLNSSLGGVFWIAGLAVPLLLAALALMLFRKGHKKKR